MKWLRESEIYNVNITNAFDLLSSFGNGTISGETLELDIQEFRKYSTCPAALLPDLKEYVEKHKKIAADMFITLWKEDFLDSATILFVAYIIDERIITFGSRWEEEFQIESIKQWEAKNSLDSELSENYGRCLAWFIQNLLVYESDWTRYGNAKEYTLCSSLQEFLFERSDTLADKLNDVKKAHYFELPF